MKKPKLRPAATEAQLTPTQLRKQACRVFGSGTTVQLFGTGGRVLTGDGRQLEFSDMPEWAQLIEHERPASKPPPSRSPRTSVDRGSKPEKSQPESAAKQDAHDESKPQRRSVRFVWEMF
jgi:hypothetical protein